VAPQTRYARNGDVNVAYQVVGEGPLDLVLVPGFISHIDLWWSNSLATAYLRRLSSFSRLILFDKPGTGLSDPVVGVPTLEQRMEDLHAVLDAVGSERCALHGASEGGPMSLLFTATYPERVSALILYGTYAKGMPGPDYFPELEEEVQPALEYMDGMIENWGDGRILDRFAPSVAGDPVERRFWGLFQRAAASPGMVRGLIDAVIETDVRHILPTIRVPTLVLHRRDELVSPAAAGRYLAENIPGARYVELEGTDHVPWFGDANALADEIEEFLTGTRETREPDRALATVLFTDICGSTERAAELGDRRWRELLERHDTLIAGQVNRFRGRLVKSTGDGVLARFDGPARAIRCAGAITEEVRELGIDVRAGIHTGECELIGEDVGGMAVHIGARVAARAGPGEVLVSSTVKDLVVGSGLRFTDRGEAELKGVPDRWRLYAVDTGAPSEAQPLHEAPTAPGSTERLRPADRTLVAIARRAPAAARMASRLGRRRRGQDY
jgi:pimeloyl-ACP methyl ester carboxylesterase